ncbi:MAG: winged helix-turn-helix domain-containing protein, partial [Bacteroidales bacterium]|nr:winged helix-turn-helix domain-containing protein [Bacteroidales bacterium]
ANNKSNPTSTGQVDNKTGQVDNKVANKIIDNALIDNNLNTKENNKIENKSNPTSTGQVDNKVQDKVQDKPLTKTEHNIVLLIQKNERITIPDMSKESNLSESRINKILSSLRKKGIIERQGARKNGYWIVNI